MRLHDAQQQSRKSWPDDFPDAMAFLKEKARELIQLREENEELEFRRSQAILLAEGWKDRAQTLEEQLRDERCSIIDASSSGDSDIASLGSGSLATSSIGSISSILRRYEHTVPPIRLLDLPLPSSTSLVSIEGFDPLPALDSHTSSASPVCLADSAKDNPPPTICCSASISLQAPHPRPTAPCAPVVDWCKVESMAKEYMLLEQEFERRNANNAVAPDTSSALTTLHSPSSSPSPSTPLTSTSTSPAPSTPPVPSTPPLPIAEPKARVTPVLPFAASPIAQKLPIGELIDAPPMSWAQWAALLDAEEAGNAK
ncbi:hypothetical protein FA95DRAFT_151666 [Auriscalpium vulgare]|uniref:Uncharacterized protein n=1 Tax=Auriscalpium vulgare TaxID=40419 RepID=A0ACB8RNK0_9AGAM|nr:hypothetical protein FA95DRAFT_151666 [Auriscalpium vulgare]